MSIQLSEMPEIVKWQVEHIMNMRTGQKKTFLFTHEEIKLIKEIINDLLPHSIMQWNYIRSSGFRDMYEIHCLQAFSFTTPVED